MPRNLAAPASALRQFLGGQAAGGLVLIAAAGLALVVANGPLAQTYFDVLHAYLGPLSILHWVNDGLMALFFLLVGLEIKRELLDGQLSTPRRRVLPGIAALGGMVVPAIIYLAINQGGGALRGWAVPVATDIAFALGVLALLGRRVPVSLRIFLTALAIIDDLLAVAIIALFYTSQLSLAWLGAALATVALLAALNWMKVTRLSPYLVIGGALWTFTYLSGVHATLAGVALALTIPIRRTPGCPDDRESPLHRLEHGIQPWVAFIVIPVFGFANAGVSLAGLGLDALLEPVALGVAAGLFAGKQLGVFAATWAAIRLRLADCPEDATTLQVYGVSLLCGIGFTMSLFIGLLAFDDPDLQAQVKIGVLAGSLLSAIAGAAVLRLSHRERVPTPSRREPAA
ncbi:Na+/H+ antiporter NhaA [Sphingosinicella sp. YJ22]|uniref:Na+/H+ antiporter NhaA n=1 Tax=Sphingosinicella sp. YJ22 TaxID=1104780 RepID=UPI001FAE79D9|nr:Na+/H+ antiporter NhaA [Sphingosinicella sp. YJ22]